MKIEVNWNGHEHSFTSIEEAIAFCEELAEKKTGSDIWVNDNLYKTYMYNSFTGEIEIS